MRGNAVHFDLRRVPRLREFANSRQVWFVGLLFAALLATQAIAFLLLGTSRQGLRLALSILIVDSLLSLACAWIDDALYQAKRTGRDRVVAARPVSILPAADSSRADSVITASPAKP